MGACNKISIALVFLCVPLGCAAPGQEAKAIQCVDHEDNLLYTGPYNEESWDGYYVQLDGFTNAFYPKGQCVKMPA